MTKRFLNNKNKENTVLSNAQQVFSCALDLLSYRDFSEARLRERLREKGAEDDALVDEAIAKLKDYNLLNEERYAQRVYEAWLAKRVYGRQHLQAELYKRGVAPEAQRLVLEQFTDDVEAEQAENAAQLFLQKNRKKLAEAQGFDKKLYAAAGRFLMARGFSARYLSVIVEKLQ